MKELAPFGGAVAEPFARPEAVARLREIVARPAGDAATPFSRSRLFEADLDGTAVVVKSFGGQGRIGSALARRFGSKARRSWEMAGALRDAGVGTPAPVAFLERWEGGRLRESFFVTEREAGTTSLREALIGIYRREPQLTVLLPLLEAVATEVGRMHDAGIRHGDLGNQNVLVRRAGPEAWNGVRLLDLNRGRVRARLPLRERARDHSRIRLPSELRRIFQTMAFGGHRPPRRFLRWEALYRALFWIHTKSRPLRHPRRWWRARRRPAAGDDYPAAKSLWIWDERSGQAIGTMRKGERYLLHSIVSGLQTSFRTALVFFPAWAAYFRRRRRCYTGPVALAGRVGMTIHPRPESVERELELLRGLGKIPVLLRYYRHEGEAAWDSVSGVVRRLHDDGHPVSIALVQDRRAVEQPELWRDFVERVLGDVGGIVEYAEVGHGLNRVKWGLWSLAEYAALLRPCRDLQERFPRVGFLGPAVYDFEYHYVASTLWSVPRRLRLAALSLHLYVDRRGAPENRQYSFSTLDKFVMARAITRVSPRCEQKVVVTEVNWPLRDTGVHSPVVAPYQSKDPPRVDANVSEDEYADYMLRYYLIALCSGMVERVYWWRLRAEGFGLVADDGRLRPAYVMLREFLRRFGASTFRERPAAPDGVELFRFDAGVVAYTTAETACEYEPGFPVAEAVSATGDAVAAAGGRYRLTGRPLYLLTSSS